MYTGVPLEVGLITGFKTLVPTGTSLLTGGAGVITVLITGSGVEITGTLVGIQVGTIGS